MLRIHLETLESVLVWGAVALFFVLWGIAKIIRAKNGNRLKVFHTQDLVKELVSRQGITLVHVEPYEPYAVRVKNRSLEGGTGPAAILIVKD